MFLLVLSISLTGYGSFPVCAEETKIQEKIFESNNPDETTEFADVYAEEGKQYKLAKVETIVIESRPEVKEQTITLDQDGYNSEKQARENIPLEQTEQDGVTYYLKNSELINSVTEARTEYGKTIIAYNGLEYIDELPDKGVVTVTDSLTGIEYKRELPRSGYDVIAESWKDDFSFPVKIYSYDADSYMLGNIEVPKGADLNQYGAEFLSMLGLSPEYYQINNISLQGEPYNQNDELVQDAVAHGRRRVVDVEATFEGHVSIPAETYWHYQCVYSNINPDDGINTIYTIKAIATYGAIEEQTLEKTAWEKLIDFVSNPVTIAVLIIFFFFVMSLMLIKRKKKKVKSSVIYINDLYKKKEGE
jgi:hypothetical protein